MSASTNQPGPGRGRRGRRPGAALQTTGTRPRVQAASQSPKPWVRGVPGRQPPRGARRWFRAGPKPAGITVVLTVASRARRRNVAVAIVSSFRPQGSKRPTGHGGRRVRAGTLGTRIPVGPASPALARRRLFPPAAPEPPRSRRGAGARGERRRGEALPVVGDGIHRTRRGRGRGRRGGGGPGGHGHRGARGRRVKAGTHGPRSLGARSPTGPTRRGLFPAATPWARGHHRDAGSLGGRPRRGWRQSGGPLKHLPIREAALEVLRRGDPPVK